MPVTKEYEELLCFWSLAQHLGQEGHESVVKKRKHFKTDPNATWRKFKESAHIFVVHHPIIYPTCTWHSFIIGTM
jgi:hypothetical protein